MNNLVSIVIPSYKNRGALNRAVDSALAQEGVDVEVIVIDDNDPESKERKLTENDMAKYESDERVKYIRHPQNRNGAAARNTGIKASTGEYIAFLDDDDWFMEGKLAKQVSYLQSHPEYDGVYCMAQMRGKPNGTSTYEGDVTKYLLMLESNMYTPCLMFKREALLAINGFDEAFRRHQDFDLLLRYFHHGYKIGCLNEILTELGTNEGENVLSGEKLESMKAYFFDKFMPYIDDIDGKEHGFKRRVLAKHYAGVYLNHIKHRNIGMATRIFFKYYFKSPVAFTKVITNSFRLHIKGEV